ncbi:MAG: hypothetical protein RRE21_06315 [Desulfurococcales archaeon]|nr:hypothetical protein [Desulfurococcaceae archaeon]MCC6060963.1 hypothetical protein [Desulfurococcaceae archaeon]MDT7866519.1 hypothetical protein [Desulfurococcales archaeon]
MGKPIGRSLERIVDFEVKKLLSDLSWVEYRLALLGGSEEDEIERRLLNVLRRNIVRDLELLLSYKGRRSEEAQAS